ncbi:MAG: ATP-binding cassette domain-containing protein [Firmicutes bacterium]|nr:ATP-binding cassette domain-containing protein [Bacillota bacterium]
MEELKTEKLCKRIKDFWLEGVDITVHSGEIFLVAGIEDSGNDMFIKTLQRICRPTDGKAKLCRSKVGSVVFDQNFYKNKTVIQTLKMSARLNGRTVTKGMIRNTLNLVGLLGKCKYKIKDLTQNRITRLKIACAIVGRPKVLILDRPFEHLDSYESRIIRVILKTMADKMDTAIVLTARDFGGVEEIFDTTAIIDRGTLVMTESYNNIARIYAKFSKTCIVTPEPNLAAKLITEKFTVKANLFNQNEVVINTHPDNAQKVYDYLKKKGVNISAVTRVNKSIAPLFHELRLHRVEAIKPNAEQGPADPLVEKPEPEKPKEEPKSPDKKPNSKPDGATESKGGAK